MLVFEKSQYHVAMYLTALQLGSAKTSDIADEANIERTTVYILLEDFIHREIDRYGAHCIMTREDDDHHRVAGVCRFSPRGV